MAALLTLNEYRTFAGIDPTDTRDDTRITAMLDMASSAVLSFTERDFASPVVTETRTFDYDGSGFLDIDDATAISAVRFVYPSAPSIALDPESWTARPPKRDDSQVFYYIELPAYIGYTGGSPEMGFTYNLDVYARDRVGRSLTRTVEVDGTWGWAAVPEDVKLATIWTIQEWLSRPTGDALTSEAIEGWSRAWGSRSGGGAAALAIPGRARDILVNYAKVAV